MMNSSTIDAELNDETHFIVNSSSTAETETETAATTATAATTTTTTATCTNEHKQQQQPILQWKTNKKRSRQQKQREDNVLESEESTINDKNGDRSQKFQQQGDGGTSSVAGVGGPLIIPVAPDQNKWKQKQQQQQLVVSLPLNHTSDDVNDDEDIIAIQALHDDAVMQNDRLSSRQPFGTENPATQTTIPSHANTFVAAGGTATTTKITNNNNNASSSSSSSLLLDDREVQQYHKDIDALPSALDEMAEEYQRVPISEFGAALLRGMGWRDDTTTTTTTNDEIMPRPHRLGLGAIPAMLPEPKKGSEGGDSRRPPRNIDQYQRDQRTQKQHDMYRMEREKKLAQDLQRTLQDGSIVHLVHEEINDRTTRPHQHHHQQQQPHPRARILKLAGVPGLNMVQVQMEHTGSSIVIKRNEIDGLVTREELDQNPFCETTVVSELNSDQTKTYTQKQEQQTTNPRYDEQKNNHQERAHSRTDKKRSRKEKYNETMTISWVIPNIRVRIVTEKLGRRYYKEKGIVVDVTRDAGVTLKLNNHNLSSTNTPAIVLDRIPERYLETALPKIGGNVIVVNPMHTNKYAKGRFIERDSKNKNYGIVQLYEDMDCIRLPLDDIAEWCGPLDDDDGGDG